jgi:integrase
MAKITSRNISTLGAGTHSDDGCRGLYLRVTPPNGRSWLLRVRVHGREQVIGLGSTEFVSRDEAREEATRLRKIARGGGDPLGEIRAQREAEEMTVERAVRAVFDGKTFKNAKSAQGWIGPFERHVFPKIGKRPVHTIAPRDVVQLLTPHWNTMHDTARKIRQRLGEAFDWAKVHGHIDGENPITGTLAGLPQVKHKTEARKSIPWEEMPEVFKAISQIGTLQAMLVQFIILTGTRLDEAREAEWIEIDLDADGRPVWTIPADRMKMEEAFRVPLSGACVEILKRAQGHGRRFVFPSAQRREGGERPVSENTVRRVLKVDLGRSEHIHGFRASLRSWSQDRLPGMQFEAREMILAHKVGSGVAQAYARSDYLEERRPVMEKWARHCSGAEADVVELPRRARK